MSFGITDIFILRLTGNGALDYVNTYGSSSSQLPSEMLLDPAGYYYLCGKLSASAVDFDPGPGIASFAPTTVDGFIMKYALDGSFQQGVLIGHKKSFGSELISAMTEQLEGDYSLDYNDTGTYYSFTLNVQTD